jgi:hypothetical protein
LTPLDQIELDRGPRLLRGAGFGALVGGVVGWLQRKSGAEFRSSLYWGAGAGAAVALVRHGFIEWQDKSDRASRVGIAPWPYYRPSTTYPWSEH